jgi:UDP-glucose 4-epimerase
LYCRVFHELHGLVAVSLRYFNVYGPRQRPGGPYAAVIPAFIHALINDEPPTIHGDGLQSRDFTYIDDVVSANLAALRAPGSKCGGRAYNVAGGSEITLLELLAAVELATGRSIPPAFTATRAGDVRHSCADLSNIGSDLSWSPQVGLVEGMRRTVEWFVAHEATGARRG